jgi:hypothetical protein
LDDDRAEEEDEQGQDEESVGPVESDSNDPHRRRGVTEVDKEKGVGGARTYRLAGMFQAQEKR